MTDVDFERLAWERLDGTISAENEARLDAMLAGSDSSRRRYEALHGIARELASVAPVASPAELRPRIDRAVAASSPGWRRSSSVLVFWRPRLAYLAAGLLAGAVAARLLMPGPTVDRGHASGAMVAAVATPSAGLTLDLAGIGTLALRRDRDLLDLELRLSTDRPVEISLEPGHGQLGIAALEAGGASIVTAAADGGGARFRVQGPGHPKVSLRWGGGDTEVSVRVSSEGVTVTERVIRLRELGSDR